MLKPTHCCIIIGITSRHVGKYRHSVPPADCNHRSVRCNYLFTYLRSNDAPFCASTLTVVLITVRPTASGANPAHSWHPYCSSDTSGDFFDSIVLAVWANQRNQIKLNRGRHQARLVIRKLHQWRRKQFASGGGAQCRREAPVEIFLMCPLTFLLCPHMRGHND